MESGRNFRNFAPALLLVVIVLLAVVAGSLLLSQCWKPEAVSPERAIPDVPRELLESLEELNARLARITEALDGGLVECVLSENWIHLQAKGLRSARQARRIGA